MIGKVKEWVQEMNKLVVACMPLVKNIPKPRTETWTKTTCPVCGRECWETDTFKWVKHAGIIKNAACTECALRKAVSYD